MAVTIVSFSITKTKAATVNFSASVVTPGPAFGEVGIGSFTYDGNALDGSGDHTFNCAGGTCDWSLSFTVFGQTFTQFDDMGYNFAAGNPDLIVKNFNSFEFDYLVAEAGAYTGPYNEIFITDPRILAWGFVAFPLDPGLGSVPLYTGNIGVIYAPPVPLPAALPLFGCALSLLGYFGWRRKRMAAA